MSSSRARIREEILRNNTKRYTVMDSETDRVLLVTYSERSANHIAHDINSTAKGTVYTMPVSEFTPFKR